MPTVVIVIPYCNGKEILLRCLESLQNDKYDDKRVLLVDNASTDDSVTEAQKAYPWLEVLPLPRNFGFSGGVTYNIPIVEMIAEKIKKSGLKMIAHSNVPNGDGGIAIGQNTIIGNKFMK